MKVIFTAAAIDDLQNIAAALADEYPEVAPIVQRRFDFVLARIARWPESARQVVELPELRVAPLVRFPYNIFYRVTDQLEILHVSHTSRRAPWEH